MEKIDAERKTALRRGRNLGLTFLFYAFAGWCYESLFLCPIREHQFVNRGYLFGPWLPIYGFGALILLGMLSRLRQTQGPWSRRLLRALAVFLAITLLATAVELAAAYVIQAAGKDFSVLWYYGSYSFNFQGRVALWPSVRFGIVGMLVLYVLQPLLEGILRGPGRQKGLDIAFLLLGALFLADLLARHWLGSNFTA